MSLSLTELKLQGFRSFNEEVTIPLPKSGMVLIRGENGSGKTSIISGIAYAMGYSPFPATKLQNWNNGSAPLRVSLKIDNDGEEVIIDKSPSNSKISFNNKSYTGSAVEAHITKLTGLSSDMREALTYRKQRTPGLFISKTDSEKKEFLSSILRLNQFEDAVEKSQTITTQKEIELINLSANYTFTKSNIDDIVKYEKPVPPPVNESIKAVSFEDLSKLNTTLEWKTKQLENLKNTVDTLKAQEGEVLAAKLANLDSDIAVLNKLFTPAPKIVSKFDAAIKQATLRKSKLEAEYSLLLSDKTVADHVLLNKIQEAKLRSLKSELVEAKIRKDSCVNGKCPTCLQSIALESPAHTVADSDISLTELFITNTTQEIALLNKQIALLTEQKESKLLELSNKIKEFASLESSLVNAKWEEEKVAIEAGFKINEETNKKVLQIERSRAKLISEFDIYKAGVDRDYNGYIQALENEIKQMKEDCTALNAKILLDEQNRTALIREFEFSMKLYETYMTQVKSATQRLEFIQKDIDACKKEINAEKDFCNLIGRNGFLGVIFDEVLAEITQETNKLLSKVPNVSHVTVHFSSENVTAKGKVKKEIVPIISINGYVGPFASGCSGGMQSSIEFAVDLAVSMVIFRRVGVVPSWLLLDECFEGMDLATKEACMEILQVYAQDRLILVVDHSSEFKELFNTFIDVELVNGVSTIKVS